ncbi:MAG: LysE family transporter [Planctomycetaceae bacterium]|nr:LysE family transporter [Planctomycetales bacterium]MCB9874220.1 LysE family transporter [Planctomycetaceae bacterium]HRX79966.1 LysE family transporter [Pirellulaceae bacterium]
MISTFIIVLPLLLSPGPANLVTFALAARFGFARVLSFQLGIIVVYFIVAFLLGLVTHQLAAFAPYGLAVIRVMGGLFIVYLGVRLAYRTRRGTQDVQVPRFAKGVLFQCFNPKYPPVVLTVFASRPDEPTVITAGVIAIVGAMGLFVHSTAGSLVRYLSPSDKWSRNLDVGFGVLLALVGFWIAVKPFISN